jgi:hypothetical protein
MHSFPGCRVDHKNAVELNMLNMLKERPELEPRVPQEKVFISELQTLAEKDSWKNL